MSLKFYEDGHKYISLNGEDVKWKSVTSLVHGYSEPFNKEEAVKKAIKNKKSKWYGLTEEEVLSAWDSEGKRSQELGTYYHSIRENALYTVDTINTTGLTLPIIKPIYDSDGGKIAPNQRLANGIYPEHLVYLKSVGLCGQSDRVEVKNGIVDIIDYKTSKEIKTQGFINWEGEEKKMKGILAHLPDCNLNHYSLQLSIYMYMILRHNPFLKPGKLTIEHIIFEKEGEDKYGYPIYKKDENGFIVEDIVPYEVPYLKNEVIAIIESLKK